MVSISQQDGTLVCSFTGRLDTADCGNFEERLDGAVEGTELPVAFDMAGVDFVSSMFLRICIRTFQRVGRERFMLMNVSPAVKKVLKIAALDSLFE